MAEMNKRLSLVLLGKIGAGKSASGNTILGRPAFESKRSFTSVTQDVVVESGTVCGRLVTVYDTPGLFNPSRSDEEIQQIHSSVLQKCESSHCVFLLVIKVGRFTEKERKTVEMIEKLLGENRLKTTWILFTGKDKLEEEDTTIEKFINEIEPLKKIVQKYDERYHVFNNEITGDATQVQELLTKICRPTTHPDTIVRIVLLGSSVSENSLVGNFILGRAAFDSEAPPDVVERVRGRLKDRDVMVISSPQLLQRNISDHQITQTVRECVFLSDPGPHVILLLLKHEPCSAEDQERVEKVLLSFSEQVYQHTMVLTTQEPTETSDILQNIIQKCANRHFSLQRSSSPDDLLQMFEDIVKMNDGRHMGENKDIEPAEKIQNLFHRLHLEDRQHNKLRAADVLQITEHSLQSHESCAEEEMIQTFLQKLLMMNYRARYIQTKQTNEQDHTQQREYHLFEDEFDIFNEMFLSDEETSQSDLIHPMDVQMAVFHRADVFLKQLMVTKLSQCQYALPLLVPDPDTQQIEFPLWTFRQINKSWKIRNTNEIISHTQLIYKTQTPMVFFFRFGSVSSSKSQLMNSLINEKHNTFFHRHCPGSTRTRVLMDGVVEISWFCPSGRDTDNFTECVAFCNLHGDAGDHEKQLQILTDMSSVNVVLLPHLDRNDRHAEKIQNLYRDRKPLICLFTEDQSAVTKFRKGKFKIGLKDRNQSDVSEELRRVINDCLSESSSTFRLEDVSKHSEIRVDEEDDDDCRRGRAAAQQMMSLLEKKDLIKVKELFLPHQGKLWHRWSQKNRELHQPRGDETEMDISRKHTEMRRIRQQQHESDISEFMKLFIKEMNSHAATKIYFLKWLRILLDEHTSPYLSALHHKYDNMWSTVLTLKEKHDKSEQLKVKQTELERISEEIGASVFGVEHIMREIGQIYESCSSVQKNKKDLQVHFSSLPSLAAEMMISGSPLELMDGDAAHVPVIWISAVLDQLIQKLGDQRVFVLSVLGLRGSGKSTMLNTMFGLQSAVSAGRTTRGAFMQLIRVSDEMKTQMNTDYVLVVDTEGLHALELSGISSRHHDNEFSTFVVGLGNLTLINIFGENPGEMQDILQIVVQAFMRMKKVRLNPSFVFVHQNVSDITAGEKYMEGRRQLQETLDEMTKLAAKNEVCDAERFSDVIRFDVQKDVKYFSQFWEGSPPMAPPNPNYCENIQELKETIMSHAAKSHGMMLTHLKDHIKDLWEALLKERFVFRFRNSLEISTYKKLETEYRKWSWRLRSAMMETENKLHNKIENEAILEIDETDLHRELKKTSEEVKKSMSEFFEKDRDADILIQWKTSFEIKIKDLQENIVRETKKKLNEILQQRHLKKKIDAQRTHHENTLYEKSKELAFRKILYI